MPIALVRVDDRLLHGQVSHGWVPTMALDRIVVADDRAAADAWEREVYEASAPDDVPVEVITIDAFTTAYAAGRFDAPVTLVLVRGPEAVEALVERGVRVHEINVGGLHAAPDRVRFRDDLQLTRAEAAAFERLATAGIRSTFRALPGDDAVPLPSVHAVNERIEGT